MGVHDQPSAGQGGVCCLPDALRQEQDHRGAGPDLERRSSGTQEEDGNSGLLGQSEEEY